MADKRVTELNWNISPQLSDVLPIVNNSETKKIAYGTIYDDIRNGLVSGSSQIDITQTQNYGNVMVTGSLSDGTITFTKGDSSTFDINLGSVFTKHAYLSCYSTSSQTLIESGSEQSVIFDSVWTQHDVSIVSGSQITFAEAGVYQFNFTAQLANSDNAVHESYFWIKYNGNNFPHSTTQMTLQPRKSADEPSAQLMTMTIVGVAQNPGDYIQLCWTGDSTTIELIEKPTFNGIPETPSIVASIIRVR